MNTFSRASHRVRQFWRVLFSPGRSLEGALLSPYLTPAEIVLFQQMQPSEQQHAWAMLERLQREGHSDADLLKAALLHDVGKILAPLTLGERVIIVLGRRLLPRAVEGWGTGELRGLSRAFVVSAHHPAWGADLASEAGASARVCELIRRHQDQAGEDALLCALQAADDERVPRVDLCRSIPNIGEGDTPGGRKKEMRKT